MMMENNELLFTTPTAAKKAGAKWYNGKPCHKCSNRKRLTSNRSCYSCSVERTHNWREGNKEHILDYAKSYKKSNRTTVQEYNRRYKKQNKTELSEYNKQYKKQNSHRINEYNTRRTRAVRNSTPEWADISSIIEIYAWAKLATIVTGLDHHVDHVIPLQGKHVCGLHVETNLRVVPCWDNLEKNNNFEV